jgi:hypothetical protein
MKPNPEVFARTLLSELARLRAEVICLRLGLYDHMSKNPTSTQTLRQMNDVDQPEIDKFWREYLEENLRECGLVPGQSPPEAPPDTPPLT